MTLSERGQLRLDIRHLYGGVHHRIVHVADSTRFNCNFIYLFIKYF